MNIIIQQILEKIIESTNKNVEMILKEGKGISDLVMETKKILDEVGVEPVFGVLEEIDKRVKKILTENKDGL